MSWTYDTTLSEDAAHVRFMLGDTDEDEIPTLSDEEIDGALTIYGAIRSAAAACAESLASRYARKAIQLRDDAGASKMYGDRAKELRQVAADLRAQSARYATPFAGGISIADKEAREGDSDRVAPAFTKELHEYVVPEVETS